jgi:hypothetical protein
VFYSRASEALFLFIRLLLAGSVAFGTYPSKPTAEGIIKIKLSQLLQLYKTVKNE